MNYFKISEIFIDLIKKQAFSSEIEIYGWLIGYEYRNIPNVLAIIECKQFIHQTDVGAVPDPTEIQEIASVIPQGIGPIGIYHSHPYGSKVFHSHIDNSTLKNLSMLFPNCISIVTNGDQITFYHTENNNIKELKTKIIEPDIPKFLLVKIDETFKIRIHKDNLDKISDKNKLKIKIINELVDYFEKNWNEMLLFHNRKRISSNEQIKSYLIQDLFSKTISLQFPQQSESNKEIIIDLKKIDPNSNSNPYETFILNIEAKMPIYISNESDTINNLTQSIKTEFISNNLIPKLHESIIDLKKKRILMPSEYYLYYFGFFLKIICFDKKRLNNDILSNNVYDFLTKRLLMFEQLNNIKLTEIMKDEILSFLKDLKKLSKKFQWQKNIKSKINRINLIIKNNNLI